MQLGYSVVAAVGFLHPSLAIAGALCGVIPVLVHLLNRRRHVRVPWAAMSFLMAARKRSARRIWIEQLLLLLTRMVLLILLGLSLARPFVPASSRLGLASSGVHHVLVVDNSLSMQAISADGISRFDRTRSFLEALVPEAESADAVSLVTMASPATAVIEDASSDYRFVRDQVTSISPTQRATDVVGALRLASDILNRSSFPPANRVVHIVSDFPKSIWSKGDTNAELAARNALEQLAMQLPDASSDIRLVVVEPQIEENVSISRLQIADPSRDQQGVPTLLGVGLPLRFVCDVENHGKATASGYTLQLRIRPPRGGDAQILRRQPVPPILPGQTEKLVVTTAFKEPGVHLVQAELIDLQSRDENLQDRLAVDNARYLSVDVRPGMPVLLVDGRPGLTLLQGQAGFLATALAPRTDAGGLMMPFERKTLSRNALQDTLVQPKVISETELAGEVLSDYTAVILCNVRRLPELEWERLEAFASGGGGVGMFCGDQIQIDHYNRYGYAQGQGLLPGPFSEAHLNADRNTGSKSPGHTFNLTQPPHPLLAEFDGRPESGLFLARVERYLPLALNKVDSEVVLTYSSQDPALVVSPFGLGRVFVCTTSANMDWNNLPAKGDFVSITLSALAYLAPAPGAYRNLVAGEVIREPLTAAQVSLPKRVNADVAKVAGREPEMVPDGDAMVLTYGPIEQAGSIELAIGSETRLFAVNVASGESDLPGITATDLGTILDVPVHAEELAMGTAGDALHSASSTSRSTELASLTIYIVLLLLLLETALASRFGTQRARKELRVTRRRVPRQSKLVLETV